MFGQNLSCLYHALAYNEFEFFSYPRVLQFAFSLIEEISKVVYSIYQLSSDQSPTATLLLLRVQEQTQSFPWLRIKPVHRSFYEFKSKLSPYHGSGSNRYNYLKSYRNKPRLFEVIDLQFSHRTKIGALERTTMKAFKKKN